MNKKNIKNKNLLLEIIAIFCCLGVVIISYLVDLGILSVLNIFILNINDIEGLFFTLFTVQASVSTVSIAIVSIITGLISENVFGISISRFITHLKPKLFKHNRLIIMCLLVTFFNYICMSFSFFNLCIALFAISIFIIILLVNDTCTVFLGKNNIRSQIKIYVINNYNEDILNDLHSELLSAIETGNTLVMNTNLDAIKEIFEKEVISSNHTMTGTIEQLSKIICDSFDKITLKHNSQKSNNFLMFICDIYSIANKNEEKILHLTIWDDMDTSFFRAMRDLEFEQLKDDGVYFKFHTELYKNLKDRDEVYIKNSKLKYYASWVYSLLISDSKYKENEKSRINNNLYYMLQLSLSYRSFNKTDKAIDGLLVYEICNLHKLMIDNGDVEGISKFFFKIINYNKDDENYNLIYMVTMIYLYYLAKRDELVEGNKLQLNAKKILDSNHNIYSYFYFDIDILKLVKKYLPFIKTILSGWEYMPESGARFIIIDSVIEDFFVFVSLDKFWENDLINNVIDILAPQSMFSLYNRYFSIDKGKRVKKLYSDFETLINKEKDEIIIDEKISILNDILNKRYTEEIINEGKKKKINDNQKEWFKKQIIDNLTNIYTETMKPFKFNNDDLDTPTITLSEKIVYSEIVSYYFFEEKNFNEYIRERIFTECIKTFIRTILKKVEYKELFYKDKEKQKALIDLAEKNKVNATIAIGNRDEFRGEEDPATLKKYTKNMQRIKYKGGYNYYFLLDNSLIEFSMEDIKVKYKNPTWDNYKHKCKEIDSSKVLYNVTNEIYIPFSKTELEEYINNTEQLVTVYANIKFRLKGEKVGVGIKITTK